MRARDVREDDDSIIACFVDRIEGRAPPYVSGGRNSVEQADLERMPSGFRTCYDRLRGTDPVRKFLLCPSEVRPELQQSVRDMLEWILPLELGQELRIGLPSRPGARFLRANDLSGRGSLH